MAISFAQAIKNSLGFLEEYGFVFTTNPQNPERPCYKNQFGEIVVGENLNGHGSQYEIYVQISGWKNVINVKEEYKKVIGKSTLLKSKLAMFKELFLHFAKTERRFYGLKILTEKPATNIKEASIDDFTTDYAPQNVAKKNHLIYVCGLFFTIIAFAQLIAIFLLDDVFTQYDIIFAIKNVLYVLILITCWFSVIVLFKNLSVFSKLSLSLYPIIIYLLLYLFPSRIDYKIYLYTLLLNSANLIVYLILYAIKRKPKYLLNAVLPVFYPLIVMLVKSFELNSLIIDLATNDSPFLIVAGVCTLIAVAIYFSIKKEPAKIRTHIWRILGVVFLTFALTFFVPNITQQTINYSFDTSIGTEQTFMITKKHTSHGAKAGPSYYLAIKINGEEERLRVPLYVYAQYEENDQITLKKHEGAFAPYYLYEL